VVNQVACENTQAVLAPEQLGGGGRGRLVIQGYATAMSVNKGQTISFKIKSSTSNYHIDILRWATTRNGDGARLIASNLTADRDLDPAGMPDLLHHRTDRLRQLVGVAGRGPFPARPSRACTSRISCATTPAATARSSSSCATTRAIRTSLSRPPTPPGRPTTPTAATALYQCTVACPPGEPRAYKGAYKVSYNRPFHTAEDDGGRSWLFTGPRYP
jgi:hypothetical protein